MQHIHGCLICWCVHTGELQKGRDLPEVVDLLRGTEGELHVTWVSGKPSMDPASLAAIISNRLCFSWGQDSTVGCRWQCTGHRTWVLEGRNQLLPKSSRGSAGQCILQRKWPPGPPSGQPESWAQGWKCTGHPWETAGWAGITWGCGGRGPCGWEWSWYCYWLWRSQRPGGWWQREAKGNWSSWTSPGGQSQCTWNNCPTP